LESKDFWVNLYASLKDDAMLSVLTNSLPESHLKMVGFTQIESNGKQTAARKPAFKAGGTSIRNRKPAEDNPWGNLSEQPKLINEDELMTDLEVVTETFSGVGDRIMPGKPCENCTCGKKDMTEGDVQKLETGQVESSCGKCYLGDAFRCASCPYSGKPAFEAGDKVKLQNADVAQSVSGTETVKLQTGSKVVRLEL